MAESELSKKVTAVIKKGDKLAGDLRKNIADLVKALRELKEGVQHEDETKQS